MLLSAQPPNRRPDRSPPWRGPRRSRRRPLRTRGPRLLAGLSRSRARFRSGAVRKFDSLRCWTARVKCHRSPDRRDQPRRTMVCPTSAGLRAKPCRPPFCCPVRAYDLETFVASWYVLPPRHLPRSAAPAAARFASMHAPGGVCTGPARAKPPRSTPQRSRRPTVVSAHVPRHTASPRTCREGEMRRCGYVRSRHAINHSIYRLHATTSRRSSTSSTNKTNCFNHRSA